MLFNKSFDYRYCFIYLFAGILFFKQAIPHIITPAVVIFIFSLYVVIVRPKRLFNSFSITYILFIFFNLFSLIDTGGYNLLSTLINNLVFLFVYTTLAISENQVKHIFISFSIFSAMLSGFLYYKYGALLGLGRFGEDLESTTFSSISISYYCIIGLISSLIVLYSPERIIWKIGSIISLILVLAISVFTGSKKAILIPIVFIIVLLFIKFKRKLIKLLLSFTIIAIIIYFLWDYLREIDILQRYFIERIEAFYYHIIGKGYDESTDLRSSYVPYAVNLFSQSPLIGTGGIAYAVKMYMEDIHVNHPHNTFLEILAGTGIIGFCLYYHSIVKIFLRLIRRIKDYVAIALFSAVFALLVNQFNSQSYNVPVLNVYFYVSYAYCMISIRRVDNIYCEHKENDRLLDNNLSQK